MLRVILDTDIGSDVDDALALCFALRSPELALEGVTTVYGDTRLRARIALKLLALAGRTDIPVAAGLERPLLRERDVLVMGHEGKGILTEVDSALEPAPEHAVEFVIRRVMEHRGEITLIAIGPLTNIAAAIIREPLVARYARELIFIGGVSRLSDNALEVPALEWNVRSDPEAARLVFGSGIPLIMLGMDVTRREATRMNAEHLARIRAAGTPLADAAARLIEIYWEYAEPKMRCIHDVAAVAYAFDRSLIDTRLLRVEIETRGTVTTGFTLVTDDPERANARVATRIDRSRFMDLFMQRMCSGNAGPGPKEPT